MLTSDRGSSGSILSTPGSVLRLSLDPSLRIPSQDTWELKSGDRLGSVLVTAVFINSILSQNENGKKVWRLILSYAWFNVFSVK